MMIPKFRVWNREIGEFWNHLAVITPEGKLERMVGKPVWKPKNCEVSLSTGLKDKNGKEMYEGDIVERLNHNGEKEIGVIEWEAGGFALRRFKAPSYTKNWERIGWPTEQWERFDPLQDGMAPICEIIGNKWEDVAILAGSSKRARS
jgi:uncharacterized phage protein (TIGR01671 family)